MVKLNTISQIYLVWYKMTEENSELIKALEILNKTLGVNSSQVKDSTKLIRKSSEETKKLDEQFKKLNQNIEKLIKNTGTSTKSSTGTQPTNNNSIRQLNDTVSTLTSTFTSLNRSAQQFQKTLSTFNNQKNLYSANNLTGPQRVGTKNEKPEYKKDDKEIIKSLMDKLAAANPLNGRGRGGQIGDYSSLARETTDTIGKLITHMATKVGGLLGKLLGPLGLLVSFFSSFVGRMVENVQKSLDIFDEFTKIGGHIGMTSDEVIRLANQAGYTSENMEKWADVLTKNQSTLLNMNMSMSAAIRSFSELSDVGAEFKSQMHRLGYAFSDQAQAFMDFADATILRGGVIAKDESTRKKQMMEYFVNQQAINSMLGVTKDKLKQEQEKLLVEEEWTAMLARMNPAEAEKLNKSMSEFQSQSPKDAIAMKEYLTKGTMITNESASLVRIGADREKIADLLRTGDTGNVIKALDNIVEKVKPVPFMFGSNEKGQSPGATRENLQSFGWDPERLAYSRRRGTKDFDQIRQDVENKRTDELADSQKELQRQLEQAKLGLGKSLDSLSTSITEKAVPMLASVGRIIEKWVNKLTFFGPKSNEFMTDAEKLQENTDKLKNLSDLLKIEKNKYFQNPAYIKILENNIAELRKKQESLQQANKLQPKTEQESLHQANQLVTDTPAANLSGNSATFHKNMEAILLKEAKKAGLANPEVIARLGATQSSLETGYGKHLAGGNNYFGIKSNPGDPNASLLNTQEWDASQGKYITTKAGFRKYNGPQESASDFIKFLQENPQYKKVLESKTIEQAILNQGLSGYSTAPDYSSKLMSIDKGAMKKRSGEQNNIPLSNPTLAENKAVIPLSGSPAAKQSLPNANVALEKSAANANTVNETPQTFSKSDVQFLANKLDGIRFEMENSTRVQEKILKTQPS